MPLEPIHIEHVFPVRSRPDILFRLVIDPKRRIKWDKNLKDFSFSGEEKIQNGIPFKMRLPFRFGLIRIDGKFNHIQAPTKATLESTHVSGLISSITQQWQFKSVPGGTEVRAILTVTPRYAWGRRLIDRLTQAFFAECIIGLQRQVDTQAASKLEQAAQEMAKQQRQAKRERGRKK
ncbi:MAG: hypothetical protein U0Z75_06995 [Deinococcaceae bacterium]